MKSTPNDKLLDSVRSRSKKITEFGYGITTADRYVKSLQDSIGLQTCYQYLSRSDKGTWASFDDVLRKAAQTLVYSNPDMEVDNRWEKQSNGSWKLPKGIEAPKNTLMIFKHTLTSSKKDRDGDILRTRGAKPDPRMLLLFNHVHTMPIGKFLGVAEHTDQVLKPYSAIVDMNDLSHDCAVMIDNDMGRFSHGFRAIEFMEIKMDRVGDSPGGFDVKEFEIMEESLVSVPANPDADMEEVVLSLVDGGKMTSVLMKEYGRSIRDHRSIRVPVTIDLKTLINGQEVSNADKFRDEEGREEREQTGTSKEADDEAEGKEREGSEDKEVTEAEEKKALVDDSESGGEEANPPAGEDEKSLVCPECGYKGPAKEGVCPECGTKMKEEEEEEEKEKSMEKSEKDFTLEKQGRVLSKANESKLRNAFDDLGDAMKMDGVPRGCKALINQSKMSIKEVLASLGEEGGGVEKEWTTKEAMAFVLAKADDNDLSMLMVQIEAFEQGRRSASRVSQYKRLVGEMS